VHVGGGKIDRGDDATGGVGRTRERKRVQKHPLAFARAATGKKLTTRDVGEEAGSPVDDVRAEIRQIAAMLIALEFRLARFAGDHDGVGCET